MVELSAVQSLLGSWWFDYDQGNFDVFADAFASDAHFACRSDSGDNEFEEFFRADLHGRDEIVAWQIDHRSNSPYPLRHNGTNVHITRVGDGEADFRSYLFVTQIVDGGVSLLSTGPCVGTAREEEGRVRFADLRVILDYKSSEVFSATAHFSLL